MGIVFRQSVKTSIIVFAGAILGALIVWMSTRYIPSEREYGFTQGLIFWSVTLSQLLLVGLNSTLTVYIHRFAENDSKRKLLITASLLIPFLLTIIFTLVYYLLHAQVISHFQLEDRALMERYFIWFPVCSLIFIYMAILEQYLGSQMKVAVASFMREIVLRLLNIILLLLFVFHHIGFNTLVEGLVLIYLVPVILFFILSAKTKAFGFSLRLHSFSSEEYKEMLHFSWFHFLLSITFNLMSFMDMLLLPFYSHGGYASVAVYRNAIFLIAILQMPSKAFIPASFTVLAKAFAENNMQIAKDIFVRSSINILIPTMGIGVILSCNLNNAVAILPHGYAEIIPIFYILFVGYITNFATGMNDQVLTIAKYYKFNFYLCSSLLGLLFLLLKFLVPRYGIYGAAWSTTSVVIVFNATKCFFVWKKLDMFPFSGNTLLVLFAALPAWAAGYFFPYLFEPARHIYVHTFMDAGIRTTIAIIVYLFMLYLLKPSPDLSEYIASVKKNKRLF